MTGPACDVDLPVAEFRIDVGYHFNHLAGLHLCRFGVERAVRLMAEVAASLALDAESNWKGPHLSHEVFRCQHLEVLGSRSILGVKRSRRGQDCCKDR